MNVLGYSGLHDSVAFKQSHFPDLDRRCLRMTEGLHSAAALLCPGRVVAAAAEERFARHKGTGQFPAAALRYCLAEGGLAVSDVDVLAHAFCFEPFRSRFEQSDFHRQKYERVLSPDAQRRLLDEWFPGTGWSDKLVSVPHHLAHAASAFYLSGFQQALVLVADGAGEVDSLTICSADDGNLRVLRTVPVAASLGLLYGIVTHYLGFTMDQDEYKVMGLAAYGNPRTYFATLMEHVALNADGTISLPLLAFDRSLDEWETHAGVLRFLEEKFGLAVRVGQELTPRQVDLAAALQAVTEACLLHVLRYFRETTGLTELCLAGGVMLNCVANALIRRAALFRSIFIQPAAGDDGAALGAALFVQRQRNGIPPPPMGLPFWGPGTDELEVTILLDRFPDLRGTRFEDQEWLFEAVADRLAAGQVVGWHQGRMEFGPRALGNRSILADPSRRAMRDRINSQIKNRESFRPFAPAVTREAASQYFEIAPGEEPAYACMVTTADVRPSCRERLEAVTHQDGSARVQIVSESEHPMFWRLLQAFAKRTGLPVLLNTSLNLAGEPIVCSVEDSLWTFARSSLDALCIGPYLIDRPGPA